MRIWEQATERALVSLRAALSEGAPIAVVYHADADGTSSAALAMAAIEKHGGQTLPLTPRKGENVHDPAFSATIDESGAGLVVVLDTGSRRGRLFRIPTIVVDHHRIDTDDAPDVEAFVSTFGREPLISTSALAWELFSSFADIRERAWLGAIGLIGDLGDKAKTHPLVQDAAAIHKMTHLRDAVSLVNAAGRSSTHEADVALRALVEARGPIDIVRGNGNAASRLHELKQEVAEATKRAIRKAPRIVGRWAIIEFAEPCRIHGSVASAWTRKLHDRIVLAGNRGYVPGRVHFSVRSHEPLDLRAELRALLPDAGPDFASGHDRATGGIVDVDVFDELLRRIESRAMIASAA
ncbi:MAG: DHH family phosphoesterase [Polyangiaceae bacterium]|nr:DHH family phosphoesterase [Polyangiaceae bacterium]